MNVNPGAKPLSVTSFQNFSDYLQHLFERAKADGSKVTFSRFAARLNLSSAQHLSLLMSGKRQPSVATLHAIAKKLGFSDTERRYAEAMVNATKAGSEEQKEYYAAEMRALLPPNPEQEMELASFQSIATWYHVVILELSLLPDFSGDPQWISRRLGGRITVEVAAAAVEKLLATGLLIQDAKGIRRSTKKLVFAPGGGPGTGLMGYYEQMLTLAKEALSTQPRTDRVFSGLTLAVDPRDLGQIQEEFLNVLRRFARNHGKGTAREAYHLGVQLFRLTEPVHA